MKRKTTGEMLDCMRRGAAVLVNCPDYQREEIVQIAREALSSQLNPSGRCRSDMARVWIRSADDPRDLSMMCQRIYDAAGYRAQFDGLLVVDVSGMELQGEGVDKLKAIGEGIQRWASEAYTLVFGPTGERAFLIAADALDADGSLRALPVQSRGGNSIEDVLTSMGVSCTPEALRLLADEHEKGAQYAGYSPEKMIRSMLRGGSELTAESIGAAAADSYGYLQRLARLERGAVKGNAQRRIGFAKGGEQDAAALSAPAEPAPKTGRKDRGADAA